MAFRPHHSRREGSPPRSSSEEESPGRWVPGATLLEAWFASPSAAGLHVPERPEWLLDGGTPRATRRRRALVCGSLQALRDKEGKPPRSSSSVAQRLVVKTKRVARRSRSRCTTRMQPVRYCGDGHRQGKRGCRRLRRFARGRPPRWVSLVTAAASPGEEVAIGRLRQFFLPIFLTSYLASSSVVL